MPIACSLPRRQAAGQVGEWLDLLGSVIATESVPGGLAVTYPAELADLVDDLVAREASCCAWLDLSTTRTSAGIRVTLSSENPDAGPVIQALAVGVSQTPSK